MKEGPAAGAEAAKLSKTAKDTQFDTPSTLPKAGAADCKASPLPPAPRGKIGPCGKIGPLQLENTGWIL